MKGWKLAHIEVGFPQRLSGRLYIYIYIYIYAYI